MYKNGKTTLFDIKKSKETLLGQVNSAENNNKTSTKKTLHKSIPEVLDKKLHKWFQSKVLRRHGYFWSNDYYQS